MVFNVSLAKGRAWSKLGELKKFSEVRNRCKRLALAILTHRLILLEIGEKTVAL